MKTRWKNPLQASFCFLFSSWLRQFQEPNNCFLNILVIYESRRSWSVFFLFGTYKKQFLKFVENLIYQNLQYQITLFDPWKSFQFILENFLDKNEQRGTLIRDPRVLVLSYYLRKPVSQSGLPLVGGMLIL